MPTVFFITHPDVVIDPGIPVPDWPLNERGRARMWGMITCPWIRGVSLIFVSGERKARDAALILADGLGLSGYAIIGDLGENDRSATGYLANQEFEATVDAFFAHPQESVRGWEPAIAAQARIVGAVEKILSQPGDGDLAIIGHWRDRNLAILSPRWTANRSPLWSAGNKWRKLVRFRPYQPAAFGSRLAVD